MSTYDSSVHVHVNLSMISVHYLLKFYPSISV
uniref:Uncharacterized protein n=1 Tax=Musa acuminata subsp. malaccensis TaxID=214687 RepID=A0A804K2H5_MUSAM